MVSEMCPIKCCTSNTCTAATKLPSQVIVLFDLSHETYSSTGCSVHTQHWCYRSYQWMWPSTWSAQYTFPLWCVKVCSSILSTMFTGGCDPPEKLGLALVPHSYVLHMIVKHAYIIVCCWKLSGLFAGKSRNFEQHLVCIHFNWSFCPFQVYSSEVWRLVMAYCGSGVTWPAFLHACTSMHAVTHAWNILGSAGKPLHVTQVKLIGLDLNARIKYCREVYILHILSGYMWQMNNLSYSKPECEQSCILMWRAEQFWLMHKCISDLLHFVYL